MKVFSSVETTSYMQRLRLEGIFTDEQQTSGEKKEKKRFMMESWHNLKWIIQFLLTLFPTEALRATKPRHTRGYWSSDSETPQRCLLLAPAQARSQHVPTALINIDFPFLGGFPLFATHIHTYIAAWVLSGVSSSLVFLMVGNNLWTGYGLCFLPNNSVTINWQDTDFCVLWFSLAKFWFLSLYATLHLVPHLSILLMNNFSSC